MYLYRYERHKSGISQSVPYLVTIGDAIASFLDKDDVYTKNMDLATKDAFRKGWPSWTRGRDLRVGFVLQVSVGGASQCPC
jgi:hypothetical protein